MPHNRRRKVTTDLEETSTPNQSHGRPAMTSRTRTPAVVIVTAPNFMHSNIRSGRSSLHAKLPRIFRTLFANVQIHKTGAFLNLDQMASSNILGSFPCRTAAETADHHYRLYHLYANLLSRVLSWRGLSPLTSLAHAVSSPSVSPPPMRPRRPSQQPWPAQFRAA
jgi:hypothetical protein